MTQQLRHQSARWVIVLTAMLTMLNAHAAGAQGTVVLSQANWKLLAVDSQETPGYAATNAFDGNAATMWATQWQAASPPPPHDLQIDLGGTYPVRGFRYLPRQDNDPNGNIGAYEFYVSTDGTSWGTPVATGTFADSAVEKQVLFTAKTGRYVRLRALTEVVGQPWTTVAELNVMVTGTSTLIPQAGWTLRFADSQETAAENDAATRAFDGNPATIWATQWSTASPPPPHEIQIDLGATYTASGFRYLPRQDGMSYGNIAGYEFYVSLDGTTYSKVATGTFAADATEKEVPFTPQAARYVRLRALGEVSGYPWTVVAEINVLASGNQSPDGVITSPATDVTILPGQAVTFAGTGSDPDNNTPLTYAWNFGAGGPPASTARNPGAVTFPTAGVYTVTFTVTDAAGGIDATPATRTVTVQGSTSTPAALISQAGWTLWYADSQETTAGNYAATNAFDGNPNTMWNSSWFNGSGTPPPHEIQIDLGATYSVAGFRYLPNQRWQAGRIGDYEFYVSPDGTTWGAPVAAGAFPDTNSPAARDVLFPAKSGRYVRLRALSEVNQSEYIFNAIAELNIWRASAGANTAPTVTILRPAAAITIPAGSAIALAGTASDPDAPLNYRWSVSPGAGVADVSGPDSGLLHFDRPGNFTVTLTVNDGLGASASATRRVTVLGGTPLATTGWTLRFVDSQELAAGNYAATRAFDGNSSTLWSTAWSASQPPPPHEIQIDLGAARDVAGFRYLPRQDGETIGNIAEYQFFVSADGVNWGAPVGSGVFGPGSSLQEVATPVKTGRYVRLQALSEVNGLPYTVVSELGILQRQCAAPAVQLTSPRSGALQTSTTLQIEAAVCASGAGQGVKFVVDGVTVGTDYSAPYAVTVQGRSLAEHVVEAYLVDASGNPIAGDATHDTASPVGIGESYVAIGDGITSGFGDDVPGDDNSPDGRNLQGGFTPILSDGLTQATGHPVAVINHGVGGTSSMEGAQTIAGVLDRFPDAQVILVNYGHNDAMLADRPSGRGLVPGMFGYAGSYKDNLQRIITAARAKGKMVLLFKPSPVLPLSSAYNARMLEYTQVIDELYQDAANGMTVAPPDGYSYFASHPAEYSDDIVLNGIGYNSMASLWFSAIMHLP